MTARDLKLDYFKVYDVEDRLVTGAVQLRGQFDRRPMRMDLVLLDFFANAVSKNGEPFYDKNAHLTWYRGRQAGEPIRRVVLENQFGRQTVWIGSGIGLLVPTYKLERGSAFPEGLDHYKLYKVVDFGSPLNVTVKLKDQFGSDQARLRAPLVLGVPVVKRRGTRTYPIRNDRASEDGPAEKSGEERHREGAAERDAGGPQHQARVEVGGRPVSEWAGASPGNPPGRD